MRIAFQMDPMEGVDINADTTFALAEEASSRGYELYEYSPEHLIYNEGQVQARARKMQINRNGKDHVIFEERKLINLALDVDVVWMRQDPPFDMSYITATHLLERLCTHTLVVNDPKWVRACPEKILPLDFPELMPETLITRDRPSIDKFRSKHKDIILKPLYGNGGAGVFLVKEGDSNYSALIEMFIENSREPLIAQAFLKDVEKGDKRIIIIDGEPVGAINRIPQKGEMRSNMHVGGLATSTDLTVSDLHICKAIGPMLKDRGQILVGIDVIGDKMTEINITSPTGVQELKEFTGIDAAALAWDAIERKLGDKT
ncbi:MAG: glutathione synthase [Hellea sp.]|jgi:glutathione synthase|nr:glutathione synthase [Hellea sp.]MBT4996190.1 glutathione synthase [Hellea sp.]MDA8887659.1 glutathione synthase [Hellea sp.]MDA8996905.1 glutathione synthase [Hellea sp.]MDB4845195.1 glutathione synthase [Hellea sp.]MDC1061334.1 glutathione synthase [Hellea sp.]